MLFALAATAIAAQPVNLYVETLKSEPAIQEQAKIWTQVLAQELRRWGLRVTTQEDLVSLAAGKRQQQVVGCDDADCGLDPDAMTSADGIVSGHIAGDGPFLVSLRAGHLKPGKWSMGQPWSLVVGEGSFTDPLNAIHELVPKLVDGMRHDLEPGRIAEKPAREAAGPPAATPRRCSSTAAPVALVCAASALLVRRRRAQR